MPEDAGKRIVTLVAVALLGVLATVSIDQRASASGTTNCTYLNINNFLNVAYVTYQGRVSYEFQLSITIISDDPVGGTAYLSGPSGTRMFNLGALEGGTRQPQVLTFWLIGQAAKPEQFETIRLETECGNPRPVSTRVYRPGEAQPLIQPWAIQCPEDVVIDSRGSGELNGTISPPGAAFLNELRLNNAKNFAYTTFMSLANPYPAPGGLLAFLEAKADLPLAYHRSVVQGKNWLRQELERMLRNCPATKVLLTGYSQGAQVAGDVFQERYWPNVVGMVLFGDPSFNGSDPSDKGTYEYGLNGSLHKRHAFNDATVVNYCHRFDPVCQGKKVYALEYKFKFHNDYALLGEPEAAADLMYVRG